MIPLDDPMWESLQYGFGSASKIPPALRLIEKAIMENQPLDYEQTGDVWEICHDWSTYNSTYATLPHLTAICNKTTPENENRIFLLKFFGWATACLRLNKTPAAPELINTFEATIPFTRKLILQSLAAVEGPPHLRPLLGALAVCHGDAELGLVLYELYEGTFYCEKCKALIQPMNTSFNPFRDIESGASSNDAPN
ncbi:hypothetical protein [Gimesia aquarii]|uniref:Uncharacterized protein n=1 Tax=Gimesia aquarii TaxID=2527964 RepID=A0A517WSN3_9PLAN|nr:hypothetical protein [Gimesia aquarii]QDU08260.1 hypothetical protein V202x_16260 [Gimesia aquarii]